MHHKIHNNNNNNLPGAFGGEGSYVDLESLQAAWKQQAQVI